MNDNKETPGIFISEEMNVWNKMALAISREGREPGSKFCKVDSHIWAHYDIPTTDVLRVMGAKEVIHERREAAEPCG